MSVEGECESDFNDIIFSKKRSSSEEQVENFEEWHHPRGDQQFACPSVFKMEDLNARLCVTVKTCYAFFVQYKLLGDITEHT